MEACDGEAIAVGMIAENAFRGGRTSNSGVEMFEVECNPVAEDADDAEFYGIDEVANKRFGRLLGL